MAISSHDKRVFIGIDVQLSRGLAFAVMSGAETDRVGRVISNGWLETENPQHAIDQLLKKYPQAIFGIDAPRQAMPEPREHYWTGNAGWRRRRPSDRGYGRHCEVVISACGLARPQWTPTTAEPPPAWMAFGFAMFEACKSRAVCAEEVFPSAAYKQLGTNSDARIELPLSQFSRGPKDMLDAVVAAFSVREFTQGRGTAVGGGDGLGEIVLPRPIVHPNLVGVSAWPTA